MIYTLRNIHQHIIPLLREGLGVGPLVLLLGLVSCSTNEDTSPSHADTDRLETLIDESIEQVKAFRDNYGTYILYNFDKTLDFAYQFEQASNWSSAKVATIGHDDAVVAVSMLYDRLFNCYGDSYKKEFFPRKLLLTKSVSSNDELGLSIPVIGEHTAVANINSVTFAKMSLGDISAAMGDEDLMQQRIGEMHRALLADYLVKARGTYPVGDEFFNISQSSYATLMNSNRKTAAQLVAEDPDFFYNRGFFFPDEDESTYFPSANEDVTAYIRHMITMDKEEADLLMEMPMMADKMHLITVGLQTMGVNVMAINPWTEQFLTMEYVQPAVIYTNNVVTDNPKATLNVTIIRGSHDLDKLIVSVNDKEFKTVDLTAYTKLRNNFDVDIDGLVEGPNTVTLALYEKGFSKVAQIYTTGISYATLDKVEGFTIKCSADARPDEMSRKIKFSYGSDDVLHPDGKGIENNALLTTIAFEKHGWLDRYYEENDCDYRGWKMYKDAQSGLVTTIKELERGFNETYTELIYKDVCTYTLKYNADNELEQVIYTPAEGDAEVIVDNVVYAGGRMISYSYRGVAYEPKYASVGGVSTRVDILDENMSGLCFGFTATETLNPYYMPELPAVIPGAVAEIPLQLLYSQYLFNSVEGLWTDGWHKDIKDKINSATVTIDGVTWQYIFKLK